MGSAQEAHGLNSVKLISIGMNKIQLNLNELSLGEGYLGPITCFACIKGFL